MRDLTHSLTDGMSLAAASASACVQSRKRDVQARVPFASRDELSRAVAAASRVFPEWSGLNPQRRARVMFNFKAVIEKNIEALAQLLSSEHGKVIADSKGDIQRGLEVIEFACGIPHLTKGEFTPGAGPGIDVYSLRQPLGVVAGITPFNFPAMIPMWMFGVAIACGNCFILKPSEKAIGAARLAEMMMGGRAGRRAPGRQRRKGDRRCDPRHPDSKPSACRLVGRRGAVYAPRRGGGEARAGDGWGQEPRHRHARRRRDQAVNEIMGAGYGSAGERCMAISVWCP